MTVLAPGASDVPFEEFPAAMVTHDVAPLRTVQLAMLTVEEPSLRSSTDSPAAPPNRLRGEISEITTLALPVAASAALHGCTSLTITAAGEPHDEISLSVGPA